MRTTGHALQVWPEALKFYEMYYDGDGDEDS